MPEEAFCLLELIRHLVDARFGAALVAGLVVAAHADAADRLVADLDRVAAAERNHVGELALAGVLLAGFGAVAPFQRGTAECASRVGLAPRQLQTMWARTVRR